jgi:hypothetical protein
MIARFSAITQMPQTYVRNFASSLVELGNNSAGTEEEILSLSLRLASAASQAGMSESAILGISAALVTTGVRAEMGKVNNLPFTEKAA